jgi:hypothetical protein
MKFAVIRQILTDTPMPHCTNAHRASLTALILAAAFPANGETTVSLNVDYAEGRYGERERSSMYTSSLIVRHNFDGGMAKINLPYVQARGLSAAGGDRSSDTRQAQEGLGDVVGTLAFDLLDTDGGTMVDVGTKVKWATADSANDLITTGRNDYSLFADGLSPIGPVTLHYSLGWTRKGNPSGVDFRNPWYGSLGLSTKLDPKISLGVIYDYRQPISVGGAPIREATWYVEGAINAQYRLQLYLVSGHADASPDFGAGLTLSARY